METTATQNNPLKKSLTALSVELLELQEVRSCYNHFLCTGNEKEMTVAFAQVQLNRAILNKEINKIHLQMDEVKAGITALTNNLPEIMPTTRRYNYQPTASEDRAIMLFNSDKRFTITE